MFPRLPLNYLADQRATYAELFRERTVRGCALDVTITYSEDIFVTQLVPVVGFTFTSSLTVGRLRVSTSRYRIEDV